MTRGRERGRRRGREEERKGQREGVGEGEGGKRERTRAHDLALLSPSEFPVLPLSSFNYPYFWTH